MSHVALMTKIRVSRHIPYGYAYPFTHPELIQ